MDFELHAAVSLKPRSFNVLVASRQTFIEMLNCSPNLQRYEVLYVSGNFSGIQSRLHRTLTELEVRRGFTMFQIMTILEEACHSLIIVNTIQSSMRTLWRWWNMSPRPLGKLPRRLQC